MVLKKTIAAALCAGLALTACSTEQVADNTGEAVVFVGRTAVKAAYGAGKLAVRGGKAAIDSARASQAEREAFPAGTPVCQNASGGYYEALQNEEGQYLCLPKDPT